MSERADGTRNQTPEDVRQAAPPRPTFTAGDTVPGLSSWLLERKLGGGGFGEVWLARHALRNEKPRAVKFCLHPEAKNRLVTHEKNVVARVMKYAGDHPNVVPLLEYNLDGGIPWLMYEFVEGGTLADLIEQWKALPLPKRLGHAVRVLHAIAGALARFHRFDPPLVHRDVKPQNVLMADGKVPRITDFGIGSVVVQAEAGDGAQTALAARVPSAMHCAGTRGYAPPEQVFFGRPPHPRDDVYALGVIAYQMVLGDLLTGPGADASLELRDLKVPGELASLIVRSVAVNPDRRPKDATEWEATLAALVAKSKKQPTAATGSKPTLLDEVGWPLPSAEARAPTLEPMPLPEPTRGPSARTESPPIPLPLPPLPPLKSRPSAKPTDDEPEPAGSFKVGPRAVCGLLAVLSAMAFGVFLMVRPPSAEKLFVAIDRAETPDAKIAAAERYLKLYGDRSGERTDLVAAIYRDGKVRERERQLHNRLAVGRAKPEPDDDPEAYNAAWQAMEAEREGRLEDADHSWQKVKARFPDEAKMTYTTNSELLAKARWGWLGEKRLKDLAAVKTDYGNIQKNIRESRPIENSLKTDPTNAESLAIRALRLRDFGDLDRAAVTCDKIMTLTEKELDKRTWYLLASQMKRSLPSVGADALGPRLQRLDVWLKEAEQMAEALKNDPDRRAERREVRNRCRDVTELYDDDAEPVIKARVERAGKIANMVPRS